MTRMQSGAMLPPASPYPFPRPHRGFWLVLAAAVVLRALLLPIPNVDNDFVFQSWSRTVTVDGFHTIYDVYVPDGNPSDECQYPPGYLYVLRGVGGIYQALFSPDYDPGTILLLILLRLPTVLADLALGVLLFLCLGRWGGTRAAHLGFAAYVLCPAMIWDSTIITQIDSVQSLLMVGTVLLLAGGRNTAAIACLALAALTKHQAAVLAPLVLFVVIRRRAWRSILVGGAISLAILLLLSLPFLLNGRTAELVRVLTTPVGTAPYVSLNAYNLWCVASLGKCWVEDTRVIFNFISCRTAGLLFLGMAVLLSLYRLYRDLSRDSILLAAMWTCFAFFMLCTEMTERYILVVLPLVLLLTPSSRTYAWLYGLLAVTAFINLYIVFPLVTVSPWDALSLPHSNFLYYTQPGIDSPLPVLAPWSKLARTIAAVIVALVNMGLLGYVALKVWPHRRFLWMQNPVGADNCRSQPS